MHRSLCMAITPFTSKMDFAWIALPAVAAIALHVFNYNATAQYEHRTRAITKMLGPNAVYYYAVYLVLSASVRNAVIKYSIEQGQQQYSFHLLPESIATPLAATLMVVGILLNLWTLKVLGIKGMYNGDSFGFLMDAPVTSGPYQFLDDPQYVGTTMFSFGTALWYSSLVGVFLSVVEGLVFYISVKYVEGPHLQRLYSGKGSKGSSKKAQ